MTLHHVPDTAALFGLWYEMLLPGGYLCFSDLDTETGPSIAIRRVFHFGFDRNGLRRLLQGAGFTEVRDTTATAMSRDVEGKGICEFPVIF